MDDPVDRWATPEEAARGDMPERFVTVLGVREDGDSAVVWMLTNDAPPYEPYTVECDREDGFWVAGSGVNDISGAPPEVRERATHLGWS